MRHSCKDAWAADAGSATTALGSRYITRQHNKEPHMELDAEAPEEAVAVGLDLLQVVHALARQKARQTGAAGRVPQGRHLTCILSPTSRSVFSRPSLRPRDLV